MAPIRDLINDEDSSGEDYHSHTNTETSLSSHSSGTSTIQEIASSFPQINQTEVTKLIIQTLTDLGYHKASDSLKKESGLSIESPDINEFINCLKDGEWIQAIERIPNLKLCLDPHMRRLSFIKDDMSTGEEDEDLMKDIEEEEQQIRTLIKFLIQRERFLEKLYSEDESSSASSNQSSASP
ncbi:hypothetical protein WICPIJ_000174, partial [Wickerhamomyces pijperi]